MCLKESGGVDPVANGECGIDAPLFEWAGVAWAFGHDILNSKRLIKRVRHSLNQHEMRVLNEIGEHSRLLELNEAFTHHQTPNGLEFSFTLVYEHAVPVLDFVATRHKYSEELVINILRQLIDATQWLHLHGYAHLNIHPLSVLNASATHCNVKLSGLDNMRSVDEMRRDARHALLDIAGDDGVTGASAMPVEFAG